MSCDINTITRLFSCKVWRLYSHHTHTVWTERPKKDAIKEIQAWHRGALSMESLLTRVYRSRWHQNPVVGTRRVAILGFEIIMMLLLFRKIKSSIKNFALIWISFFSLLQLIPNFFWVISYIYTFLEGRWFCWIIFSDFSTESFFSEVILSWPRGLRLGSFSKIIGQKRILRTLG